MTKEKELQDLIESLLVEKTFSIDAVNAIKQMRDDFITLKDKNDMLTERNVVLSSKVDELETKFVTTDVELTSYKEREKQLVEREKKVDLVEQESKFHLMRVADVKELFFAVFKNPTIKRELFHSNSTSTPVPVNNGGYTSVQNHTVSASETKNEKETVE